MSKDCVILVAMTYYLTRLILKHDFKGLGEFSLVQVIYSVLLHVLYELFVEVVKTLQLFQEVCQSN